MSLAYVAPDTASPIRDWTVGQLLERAADRACEAIALKQPGTEGAETLDWSYGELLADTRRLAGFLLGHFANPAATAAAFDDQGFLRTGDLGTLADQGYLRVTGRLKEMIIRGGENIYPREIEDALGEYPGVVEAAVVGVPHPRWGEEVAVAIRCSADADADAAVDPEAVRAFLLERIARHKVPKLWRVAPDFPRTPSGKIQKFEVVRWFEAQA